MILIYAPMPAAHVGIIFTRISTFVRMFPIGMIIIFHIVFIVLLIVTPQDVLKTLNLLAQKMEMRAV